MSKYSSSEILDQLDCLTNNLTFDFPIFGNSFLYVDSRMSVFSCDKYWGILIESIEVDQRAWGHHQILDHIFRFGNHLKSSIGSDHDIFEEISTDGDSGHVFGDIKRDEYDCLNPKVRDIRIRDNLIPIPNYIDLYTQKGISVIDPEQISQLELMRALTPEYRDSFFMSLEQKQQFFKGPIPQILQLEKWYHPLLDEEDMQQLPSKCETFQLIAKAITACDPNAYIPTMPPNTHWKNWMLADDML